MAPQLAVAGSILLPPRHVWHRQRGGIKLLTFGRPRAFSLCSSASGDMESAYAVTDPRRAARRDGHGDVPLLFRHRLAPDLLALLGFLGRREPGLRGKHSPAHLAKRALRINPRSTIFCARSASLRNRPHISIGNRPGILWASRVPPGLTRFHRWNGIPDRKILTTNQMAYRKADENDARLYPLSPLSSPRTNCILRGPSSNGKACSPASRFLSRRVAVERLDSPSSTTASRSMTRVKRSPAKLDKKHLPRSCQPSRRSTSTRPPMERNARVRSL